MPGFIHGELEQKILILYILSRLSQPVPFDSLLDLSLCDDGIDYFDFTERLSELLDTGHVASPEKRRYVVTDKGRRTAEICETELAQSVRTRCRWNAERCNRALRRLEQVRATVEPRLNGTFTARLILDDDMGNLMDLQVMAPDKSFADALVTRFRRNPERTYHSLMNLLLQETETPESDSGAAAKSDQSGAAGEVAETPEKGNVSETPENATKPETPEKETLPKPDAPGKEAPPNPDALTGQ